jgi:hypothetical protein
MRTFALLVPLLLGLAPQEDLDKRVDQFAGQIVPGTDETAAKFQKVLKTRPGKIVLRDRAEKAAEVMRRLAERDAVPEYFKARFDEKDGVYRLKAGQEEYRKRLLDDHAAARADLERIRPIVKDIADNLVDEPEVNARLKKFLSHPSSLETVYHGDIRRKTRPDIYVLLRKLGEVFAQGEDGRFYVPDAKRDTGKLYAKVGGTVADTTKDLSAWLAKFAEGVAPFDDVHKRLKKEVADPLFAGMLLKKALDGLDPSDVDSALKKYREAAEEIKARIPEVFQNTPQGKILVEKHADGIGEKFAELDKARSKARVLREPARELASRLRDGDELTADLRKALQCDALLALLDIDVGGEESDAVAIVTARIKQAVEKRPDGKYQVIPAVAEEVANEIKDPAQAQAKEERALRIIAMYGEKMEDPALKAVFTTYFGRHEVERASKEALTVLNPDGLKSWIDRHFDKASDGYRLRASSKSEIETILAEAEKIQREAGKKDLKE